MGFKKRTLAQSRKDFKEVVQAHLDANEKTIRDHGKILIRNDVVEYEPMTMPLLGIFQSDSMADLKAYGDAAAKEILDSLSAPGITGIIMKDD